MFDVGATEFGSWGIGDTVQQYFCRGHVSCMCGEFVWIIDEVSANSDPDTIWVIFLGAVVDDISCVFDGTHF